MAALVERAHAEAPLLRAEVLPLAMRPRTAAPTFIDVKIHSRQQAILEGVLELRVFAEGELQFRQQTRELALAPGVTTLRILIPPAKYGPDVQLSFLSRKGSIDLGRFQSNPGLFSGRQYLIGICGSSAPMADARPRLWQALRPEWIAPDESKSERRVTSTPVWLAPEDLPSAVGLCAFDLLVIEGRSFASLEEKQLDQLTAWVEAGGSLCVAPQSPLSAAHLAFLNQLAGGPGLPPAIVSEAGNSLTFRDGSNVLSRPGLGRMAIVSTPPATEAEIIAAPWKPILDFLSKKRRLYPEDASTTLAGAARTYVASRPHLAQSTLMGLFPRTSRTVPVPLVITLLGAFVLLVGPGEWMVLGRLRKRRWTWLTFPLLAVAFTMAAVRAAEHYLGRTNRHAALVVTDLGPQGRVLRQNILDLHFAGRNTSTLTEIRQAMTVSCAFDISGRGRTSDAPMPLYQGSVPGQYSVVLPLKQWSPHLQRTLTFRGDAVLPTADWDQITARSLSSQGLVPMQRWVDQLRQQGWTVQFMNGPQLAWMSQSDRRGIPYQQVTEALSRLREGDNPGWAAAYSPSGSGSLSDMALLDPTNPGEWLVVATKSTQQTLHMVRRLYSDE